jgi:hypothetical protein
MTGPIFLEHLRWMVADQMSGVIQIGLRHSSRWSMHCARTTRCICEPNWQREIGRDRDGMIERARKSIWVDNRMAVINENIIDIIVVDAREVVEASQGHIRSTKSA